VLRDILLEEDDIRILVIGELDVDEGGGILKGLIHAKHDDDKLN